MFKQQSDGPVALGTDSGNEAGLMRPDKRAGRLTDGDGKQVTLG